MKTEKENSEQLEILKNEQQRNYIMNTKPSLANNETSFRVFLEETNTIKVSSWVQKGVIT